LGRAKQLFTTAGFSFNRLRNRFSRIIVALKKLKVNSFLINSVFYETMLLPHRWVVERSFSRAARFRRLARDYERLPETLAELTYLACAMLMFKNFVHLMAHVH